MSVIYVSRRSTESSENFDDNSMSDQSLLLINTKSSVDDFSVDFTVGEFCGEKYGPENNQMQKIDDQRGLMLGRYDSIVVEVHQHIRVPHNMFGIIVPTGSLFLDRGIIIAAAKVEPSFNGKLKLRLFNTTAFRRNLKKGDKIASAIFFSTETTRFQKEVTKQITGTIPPTPLYRQSVRWIKANLVTIIGWLIAIIGSSTMSGLISYMILRSQMTSSPPKPLPAAITEQAKQK